MIGAFKQAAIAYGGVDIVVNNAGLATSSPFDQTSLNEWNLNMSVLATGYFLVAREAFKLMKVQGTGGSMVFVGSKKIPSTRAEAHRLTARPKRPKSTSPAVSRRKAASTVSASTPCCRMRCFRALQSGVPTGETSVRRLTELSRIS